MTTRDKGITLPTWENLRLSQGYFEVSSVGDFSSDTSYKYSYDGVSPLLATSVSTIAAPSSVALKAQNASAGFASVGGDVKLTPGVGSVGNSSGNVVIKDTTGAGGSWNTTHIVLGTYHLWFDANSKLRYKIGAPTTDLDGTIVNNELSGSAIYDPPSLAVGVGSTTTIVVANAALGDFVLVSFSSDLQGITLTAYISSAGTVSIRFQNQTAGVIDLASGTLNVRVIKQ